MLDPDDTPRAPKCSICDNLLGDLPTGHRKHPFCTWAKPEDWRALSPWFKIPFQSVSMAGC